MSLSYNPSGYRNLLRMSHKKRLLLEGKEDKQFFKLLLDEFCHSENKKIFQEISIDIAEIIDFEEPVGNRKKVERICRSVKGASYSERLVGFVDREFREFALGDIIQDNLSIHKIQDRLVWSRGHSIENYLFDFSILRNPLRDLSATDCFDEALELFEKIIESAIRTACAASLAGKELEKLKLLQTSFNWKLLEVRNSQIILSLELWEQELKKRNLPLEETHKIIDRYQYWSQKIETVDFHLAKWICHGHIGIAFIWATYSRCVYEVCVRNEVEKPETEVAGIQGIKESNRVRACASWWARQARKNQCDYPLEVIQLLGLNVSDETS